MLKIFIAKIQICKVQVLSVEHPENQVHMLIRFGMSDNRKLEENNEFSSKGTDKAIAGLQVDDQLLARDEMHGTARIIKIYF